MPSWIWLIIAAVVGMLFGPKVVGMLKGGA